jgi:hypothetical protein
LPTEDTISLYSIPKSLEDSKNENYDSNKETKINNNSKNKRNNNNNNRKVIEEESTSDEDDDDDDSSEEEEIRNKPNPFLALNSKQKK